MALFCEDLFLRSGVEDGFLNLRTSRARNQKAESPARVEPYGAFLTRFNMSYCVVVTEEHVLLFV